MKHITSFLTLMIVACGAFSANASECIGEGCEITPFLVKQTVSEIKDSDPKVREVVLWSAEAAANQETCTYDYECPFDTVAECNVWYKKPVYKTYVAPRASHLSDIRYEEILYAINSTSELSANDDAAAALLERYQILMRASRACCSEGIIYKLHEENASEKRIYQFLKDDANYFAIGERCLITTNDEIADKYSSGVDGKMVADVRSACLCKNREWFEALIAPFYDVYERAPQFEPTPFYYTYIDGLQREITVSINEDVHKVMGLLESCPK